ncbi:MAG: hypothetical protein ABIU95_13350 [Burkholderiales bacterium]
MRSWVKDNMERPTQTHTERLFGELSQLSNLGGYSPRYRNVNESRCQTIIDLRNGDTQEQNVELGDFATSVLEGRGPVIAAERDTKADCAKSSNLLYWLIEKLL